MDMKKELNLEIRFQTARDLHNGGSVSSSLRLLSVEQRDRTIFPLYHQQVYRDAIRRVLNVLETISFSDPEQAAERIEMFTAGLRDYAYPDLKER